MFRHFIEYPHLAEIVLGVAISVLLFVDMFSPRLRSFFRSGLIALIALVVTLWLIPEEPGSGELFILDRPAFVFQWLIAFAALIVVLVTMSSKEFASYRGGEYYSLILGGVFGSYLIATANDFIVFILGFETLSLSSYILTGYLKHNRLSAEASLKYLLYGAVSSAIMFFGISYLYGLSGTLSITGALAEVSKVSAVNPYTAVFATFAIVLVLCGIGFKIAMVPFHFWCPDAYEGAATPVTAYLAVVSKLAGFAGLLRVVLPLFGDTPLHLLPYLFGFFSLITMSYGNLVALRQTDAKRLLAYSSIAHAGYLLLAFAVFKITALEPLLVYLTVYLFMTFAAFWAINLLARETRSTEISSFSGYAYRSPFLFSILFLSLISLTGLPPTAGFSAKFLLFQSVIDAGLAGPLPDTVFYFVLAVAGVLNSVVSLYYYMLFAKVMVFETPSSQVKTPAITSGEYALGAFLAIPLLVLLDFSLVLKFVNNFVAVLSL